MPISDYIFGRPLSHTFVPWGRDETEKGGMGKNPDITTKQNNTHTRIQTQTQIHTYIHVCAHRNTRAHTRALARTHAHTP